MYFFFYEEEGLVEGGVSRERVGYSLSGENHIVKVSKASSVSFTDLDFPSGTDCLNAGWLNPGLT